MTGQPTSAHRQWRHRSYGAITAALVLPGLAISTARATDFAYGGGYVLEHTSNIDQVATSPRDEWIHSLIGGIAYSENTADLAAHAVMQAQENIYQNHRYDDTPLYFVDAAGIWTIAPQRLTWTVEDHHRQLLLNVQQSDTLANQAGANVFSTGPDVYSRPSVGNTLVLGGRYAHVYLEHSNADNDRGSAYTRWLYELNSSTTLSLNYEALKVTFSDSDVASNTNVDYLRTDRYVRFDWHPSRSRVTLDYGHTTNGRDQDADLDGQLARLTWTRQMTPESSFGLTAAREQQDVGAELLSEITDPTTPSNASVSPTTVQVAPTSDVYYLRRIEAYYRYLASDWATEWRGFSHQQSRRIGRDDLIRQHAEDRVPRRLRAQR